MTLTTLTFDTTFSGDGSSGQQFPVQYPINADTEVQVFEAGVKKTLNVNYTVSGAGSPSGFTVTWIGNTVSGSNNYRILRVVELKQQSDYGNTGPLPPETVENDFDRAMMVAQQCLQRAPDDGNVYDAQSKRIRNVADGTGAQDAVSLTQLQAQTFLQSGSIGAPANPGDDGKGLRANGGAVTYQVCLVPDAAAGDAGRALISTGDDLFDWHGVPLGNLVVNGDFRVAQRGTSFNNSGQYINSDDTWLLDRWLLLSDGNDRCDVSQETTTVPTGSYSAIKLDTETVTAGPNAEKFGICQILESRDSLPLRGKAVSLSFKARTNTGAQIRNLRAAILSWDGTADTVTSDVVSAWAAEGTNPTLVANWAYVNTALNLAVTVDSFGTHKIENQSVPTDCNNLAVFIWVDDKDHIAGDVVFITDVQLEISDIAHDFERRPFSLELALCQRYFQKTFPYATAPVTNGGRSGCLETRAGSEGDFTFYWVYSVTMRAQPTPALFNPDAANALPRNLTDGTDVAGGATAAGGDNALRIVNTAAVKPVAFSADVTSSMNSAGGYQNTSGHPQHVFWRCTHTSAFDIEVDYNDGSGFRILANSLNISGTHSNWGGIVLPDDGLIRSNPAATGAGDLSTASHLHTVDANDRIILNATADAEL